RAGFQAQRLGRAVLALDDPANSFEHAKDVVPLDGFEAFRSGRGGGGKLVFLKVEDGEVKQVEAKTETKLMARTANAGEKFRLMRPIKQKDEEGRLYDLTLRFIVEYLAHPAPGAFDDLIDAVSRIHDMEIMLPITINQRDLEPEIFVDRYKTKRHG